MVLMFKTATDRRMAYMALTLFTLGATYGIYSFGRPLYWRFYATVLFPFEHAPSVDLALEDDPFSASVLEQNIVPKNETVKSNPGTEHQLNSPAVVVPKDIIKAPFDVNNYPLTKERVEGMLQDGYIMVTWANHHYLDFAKSWVYHVQKAGVTGYLVGAMDDEMLESLAKMNINTWRMNSGITKNDLGWGSPNFHKMGRVKIALIKQFLELGVTVVISDIDTAWLRNPLPYFAKHPAADILTSTDQLRETVSDESLERFPDAGASFNIGIMMFRPKSMDFVNEWIKMLDNPQMWDQSAFNDLARVGHTHSDPALGNLWKGDQGKLMIGVLPGSIFASGHMFFVQRKYEELGLQPYVAHATFQYSGTPGKRNRFREFLLWHDEPEYFQHPKGFISINIDIPQELLDKAKGVKGVMTAPKLVNHFNLVHYQLFRIRTGLALATITGRALIMPPIWCEIDKYWAPLDDGNIPGSTFKKPFICPMDHILDIEASWGRVMPAEVFGPHIDWKEHSFLRNPRLPAAVNSSRLVVQPCGGDCPGGAKATDVQNGKISVSNTVDIARLKEVLNSPAAQAFKVLELPHSALEALHGVWRTFPREEQVKFDQRLKHATSVNCCLQEQPGWVWYDFFADMFPHTDRFNRKFEDKWLFYKGDSQGLALMDAV